MFLICELCSKSIIQQSHVGFGKGKGNSFVHQECFDKFMELKEEIDNKLVMKGSSNEESKREWIVKELAIASFKSKLEKQS